MGFRIARKHAGKLRRLALALGFGLPAMLTLLALARRALAGMLAVLGRARWARSGILVERWLFFAEARTPSRSITVASPPRRTAD